MVDRSQFIEAADDWISRGARLVPAQPNSKHLVAGFGPRQACIASSDEVRAWLGDRCCNFGIVLGRFACLDFESWTDYGRWRHGRGCNVQTVIERTARGAHIFFELASPTPPRVGQGVEFKTSGVVICAPSVHPSGAIYTRLTDFAIPRLDPACLPDFFPLSAPARPSPQTTLPTSPAASPQTARAAAGGLLARIKAKVKLVELLPASVQLTGAGRYKSARCPFHSDEHASMWLDVERQLWGCHSASCPQHGAHDAINLYAALHGCDVRQAIKELAAWI